jgi:two-component system CheB/CheR fusion protein
MRPLRVLIVEDYRDTAEMLALWAQSAGHDVRVCYTGFQAEQAAPTYRPDVVLLDIGLPDINGWELARLLRSISSVRIAAVTAYQTADDRRRSHEAGIDVHLGKPARREEILELLAQIAEANRSRL